MAVIVEDDDAAEKLNAVLHHYGEHIIGRMGIPYRARGISIAIDAPQDEISSLAGKLGNIHGISVKTAYSKVTDEG